MYNIIRQGDIVDKQIKSKERVTDRGEVFTAEREVKAMCDLVKEETERIDSRFLEPACGNGNFLAEILRRKLEVVKNKYKKNPYDYELNSVLAVTSIYGVEIMHDNVLECRKRLFDIWNKEYTAVCKKDANDDCREIVQYILELNILCGNALSLKKVDENCKDTEEPIIFAEWTFVTGAMLKRRDFRLDEMLEGHTQQISLFMTGWEYDEEAQAYIPLPLREYPPTHYRRIKENG